MRAREDLTNVQFPILNSHPIEAAACVRAVLIEAEAIRQCPLRMRIEHWELSIGQIPGRILGSGFCQVIFCASTKEKPVLCATLLSSELRSRPTPDRMWRAVPCVELQEKANRHR